VTLTNEQMNDFLKRGFSRRNFGRLATMIGAGATLPFFNEFSLAQDLDMRKLPPGAIKIDNNENPLGPCPDAIEAMNAAVANGGRYQFHLPAEFNKLMADMSGLKSSYVAAYFGSSMPLHWGTLAYTSPTRPLVIADPGYEAGVSAAKFVGAKVINVPLAKNYAHDVKAMAAADPNAGLIYVCNPNNPTGSMTSKADLEWLLNNKPAGSILMIDEAYIHFAGLEDNTVVSWVAKDKDVIVLRTFSKIYGMAGIRAAAAMARPDILSKIRQYGNTWMPTTSMAGAMASLKSKSVIAERRKINNGIREDTLAFLDKHNFKYIPSQSNKFMVDTKRPAREAIEALRKENVYVGRVWPSVPTHIRVSVGTQADMDGFKKAFLKVMA
jgi:histidinol-phosphate aminotransferase